MLSNPFYVGHLNLPAPFQAPEKQNQAEEGKSKPHEDELVETQDERKERNTLPSYSAMLWAPYLHGDSGHLL